jgi:hypothetical protein
LARGFKTMKVESQAQTFSTCEMSAGRARFRVSLGFGSVGG